MELKFKEEYKRLNKAQRQAVEAIDGPLLVVAGPGTGKTQLLSMRAANILQKTDTDPSNILCLTFTNFAATNMRRRLFDLIGPTGRRIAVKTFHSLAAEIMNEYPEYFWNGAELTIAPDAVQLEILQDILSSLPLNNPLSTTFAGSFTQLNDIQKSLQLAKEAGLSPDELRDAVLLNIAYIEEIAPGLGEILSKPLSVKSLPAIVDAVSNLPKQSLPAHSPMRPLHEVINNALDEAIAEDEGTGKTRNTGLWKKRYIQRVDGQAGMFDEIKRNQWWLALSEIYTRYRDELHNRGHYDYSDMLIEVLEQLDSHSDMLADLQERYLYLQIDEFQDTNAAQLRLSRLVADHYSANNRPNLMAVGDDDQAIFAFNGAELNNTLEFKQSYPDTKIVVLQDNYRSSQAILDSAGKIIKQAGNRLVTLDPTLQKNLVAKNPPPNPSRIEHLIYPTKEHQYYGLVDEIRRAQKQGGDVAVLARAHGSLKQLAGSLLAHGIAVRYEMRNDILQNEAVKVISLIANSAVAIASGDRAVVNFNLSRLLRHPMWELTPQELWRLAIANFSHSDWLDSLLSSDNEKLSSVGRWLSWLARTSDTQPLCLTIEYIIGLREGYGFTSPLRDYYLKARPKLDSDYLQTLSAIEVLRSYVDEFGSDNPTLGDFTRFTELNIATGRTIADESWFVGGADAVSLLSVHKAKGLEFDTVFLIDALDSVWSVKNRRRLSPANLRLQRYGESDDDYVRLLYVAASRAKRDFIVTSYTYNSKGEEQLPTPLISHLKTITKKVEPTDTIAILENDLHWPQLNIDDAKLLLGPKLEDFSLSPSSLIDFLNVAEAGPKTFIDRQILRLPTGRSAAGSYGTAIHAALETAQRLFSTRRLNLPAIIDRFEATLADQSLPRTEFELYFARGEELLKKLFANDPPLNMVIEGKAEQSFNSIFIGEARIKGTIDRLDIDSPGKTLTITDYKTGKPLKSFDTKDRTKAIKAWRHKRQLQFYNLLVGGSNRYKKDWSIRQQMCYLEAPLGQQFLSLTTTEAQQDELSALIAGVWRHIMDLDMPDTSAFRPDIDGIMAFERSLLEEKI